MTGLASIVAVVAALQVASYQETRVWGSDGAVDAASTSTDGLTAETPSGSTHTYCETASDLSKGYNGRVTDSDTTFIDYGARMYWPQIGRFISPDVAGPDLRRPVTFNRFAYVVNNPYTFVDPNGMLEVLFSRADKSVTFYGRIEGRIDSDHVPLASAPAGNNTARSSGGEWPVGTYPVDKFVPHPDANPDSSNSAEGAFMFKDVPETKSGRNLRLFGERRDWCDQERLVRREEAMR